MKKLTLFLLVMSLGLAHTAYSGIEKSKSPDNPNGVEINIHSDLDLYGVQFDLNYDSELLSLSSDDITSLVNNMNVYSKVIEPGIARVIMFSMQGERIMLGSENLAIIDIKFDAPYSGQANVSISDLILAGENGLKIDGDCCSDYNLNAGMPLETSLNKNYPNPFNPSTTIPFQINQNGYVSLKVYDMSGSLVKTLVSDYRDAGTYEIVWNGLNNDGQQVASGQYILQMSAPEYTNTLQMTFIK